MLHLIEDDLKQTRDNPVIAKTVPNLASRSKPKRLESSVRKDKGSKRRRITAARCASKKR